MPPNGTAGLARCFVSGYSRSPCPPARITARVSWMIALVRGLRGFKPISSVLESPAFHGPGEQTVLKKLLLTIAAAADTIAPGFSAISALWTFPSIIGSAMLIAWAAEAAQFLISQGLALAILAWLQPLPE